MSSAGPDRPLKRAGQTMASDPDKAAAKLQRDLEVAEQQKISAERRAWQEQQNATWAQVSAENAGLRGTTAGFYILLAVVGLVGLMIAGVYLTRQENQPQQETVVPAPTPSTVGTASSPPNVMSPPPPSAPRSAPRLPASASTSATSTTGTPPGGTQSSSGTAAVPFPVPPAPAPLVPTTATGSPSGSQSSASTAGAGTDTDTSPGAASSAAPPDSAAPVAGGFDGNGAPAADQDGAAAPTPGTTGSPAAGIGAGAGTASAGTSGTAAPQTGAP